MRKFLLSCEAAADLTPELEKKFDINVIPMKYMVGDDEYLTGSDNGLTMQEICEKMKSGLVTKTTQPNAYEFEEYFRGLLKEGKDIIHLSFSSAMSGTFRTAKEVADSLNKVNKNKIIVIDTLCQSSGLALLIAVLCKKLETEKMSIAEVEHFVDSIKLNINHFFVVETLTYLARGGRISKAKALIGNIVNIKPVFFLNSDGIINVSQNVLGRKKSIQTLIDKFKKYYNGQSEIVFIGESMASVEANYLKDELLKINPKLDIVINPLGPVIVSHSGPGVVALYFTADKRDK